MLRHHAVQPPDLGQPYSGTIVTEIAYLLHIQLDPAVKAAFLDCAGHDAVTHQARRSRGGRGSG